MKADYFRDILPHDDAEPSAQRGERSIRNINIPSRSRPGADARGAYAEYGIPNRGGRFSGAWLWILALAAAIVVSGLGLFLFRQTTVTVIPHTHDLVLDGTAALTAYPQNTAATGTLSYTSQAFDLEESATVAAQGMRHVERKASGSITVFNEYSAAPVKLLANTRFSSPDGLIFRTPAAIVVPGKHGKKPGSVSVTLVADVAGEKYNVAPARFSVPGLKSSPMSTRVYAASEAAFTGGFSGDEPATDPSILASAEAGMRGRIEQKVRDTLASGNGTIAFPDLARITYTDLPSTSGSDGVHLHERAHVSAIVFDVPALARAIAQGASADVQGATLIRLVPGAGFGAKSADVAPVTFGVDPVSFSLTGKAQLVWQVDSGALASALAGRDGSAFQTIVKGFPSIQEASARIEPFWSSAFPKNPASIRVIITAPAAAQS